MVQFRSFEILLFLIILQSSVGFVGAIGLFDQTYVSDSELYGTTTKDWNISTYGEHEPDMGVFGRVTLALDMLWNALPIAFNVLFAIVFIFDPLVRTFGVPMELAAFLQGGIYLCYSWGIVQFLTNRGTKYYE